MMKPSLKAFMKGMIDYAGLFPPAQLPLETAITNYADYLGEEHRWMLSRFIIPADRLQELEPYAGDLFTEERPFAFSVLGKPTETIAGYREETDRVHTLIKEFSKVHGRRAQTEILEIRLPREAIVTCDVGLIRDLLDETAEKFGRTEHTPGEIFYEAIFEENWKKDNRSVLEALSLHNLESRNALDHYYHSGYKLRCGGTEAEAFPSVEQVAQTVNMAREHNVAIKCTAGLHHPVRHYSEAVQTKMHGFFNVFGGAMLAYAHDLNDEEYRAILEEEDPEHFVFTDDAFRWKDYAVFTGEIADLREVALISFGSCSFEEPLEDLQKLGLL